MWQVQEFLLNHAVWWEDKAARDLPGNIDKKVWEGVKAYSLSQNAVIWQLCNKFEGEWDPILDYMVSELNKLQVWDGNGVDNDDDDNNENLNVPDEIVAHSGVQA